MPHPAPPTRPRPSLTASVSARLLAGTLACALAVSLIGCVEVSRTEKGYLGNPLQSYSQGPRNTFDADNYQPPPAPTTEKPWYRRLFDW